LAQAILAQSSDSAVHCSSLRSSAGLGVSQPQMTQTILPVLLLSWGANVCCSTDELGLIQTKIHVTSADQDLDTTASKASSEGHEHSDATATEEDKSPSFTHDNVVYTVSTVYGTLGVWGTSQDGTPLNETVSTYPDGMVFLPWDYDRMLISEHANDAVRLVNIKTGIIERTVAGIPTERPDQWEASADGDGGPATMAKLNGPRKVAVDPVTRDIYIPEHDGFAVRLVNDSNGILTTIMGKVGEFGCSGEGIPATEARMSLAHCVAIHPGTGDLYVCDALCHAVRKIDRHTGIVTTAVGTLGQSGLSGDGGQATKATMNFPAHISFDPDTYDMYIAEWTNNVIRKVDGKTGVISIYGGTGCEATSGDGGLAVSAGIHAPAGVEFDPISKDVVVSQYEPASVVRLISGRTGIITTIAGVAYVERADGDGGPALQAHFNKTLPVTFLPGTQDILVPDGNNCAIRLLKASKV